MKAQEVDWPVRQLGERLRRRREELGLSLDDVQARTKIRKKYLRALEEGQWEVMPGEVYLKGFLRAYAECVGLDARAILKEYEERAEASTPANEVVPPSRPARFARRWVVVAVVAVLLAAILLVVRPWSSAREEQQPAVPGEPGGQPAEPPTAPGEEPGPAPEQPAEPPAPPPRVIREDLGPTDVTYVAYAPQLILKLTWQGRCWVRVLADGERVMERTLEPPEVRVFTARSELLLRVGNPAVLHLEICGVDIGPVSTGGVPMNVRVVRREP